MNKIILFEMAEKNILCFNFRSEFRESSCTLVGDKSVEVSSREPYTHLVGDRIRVSISNKTVPGDHLAVILNPL